MITKFDIGDTVEVCDHPDSNKGDIAKNPWVVREIRIRKDGISYILDSLVAKVASTSYYEFAIRKVRTNAV